MASLSFDRSQEDLIRHAAQALRLLGPEIENKLTNAVILNLTTVQSLIDAINALTRKDSISEYNHRAAIEAVRTMELYGILTTARVTAADTFAGLISAITGDLVDTNQGEAFASEYGGELYMGGYATESTL